MAVLADTAAATADTAAAAATAAELTTPEKLVQVILSGCDALLSAQDLCHLVETCTDVRRAALSTPPFWANVDLTSLARPTAFFESGLCETTRYSGVLSLTVQFCDALEDRHLTQLPSSLRQLTLDACPKVTDAGIKAAVTRCGRSLESLSLYWNMHLTRVRPPTDAGPAWSGRTPDTLTARGPEAHHACARVAVGRARHLHALSESSYPLALGLPAHRRHWAARSRLPLPKARRPQPDATEQAGRRRARRAGPGQSGVAGAATVCRVAVHRRVDHAGLARRRHRGHSRGALPPARVEA